MIREVFQPGDREAWLKLRAPDLTSTDVAALFGESPYCTEFELWYRKHDKLESSFTDNARATWGRRLESAIAEGVAEDNGWHVRPFKEYIRLPEHKIGSSFDYRIQAVAGTDSATDVVLEIKTVDGLAFKQGWSETDYGLEAPPHIELQVQHQLLCSGLKHAVIAAMVGGNEVHLLRRQYDEDVGAAILAACARFWAATSAPQPDFHRDGRTLAKLYGYAEPGKVITDPNERVLQLIAEYSEHQRIEACAKDEKDARKAELLTLIGDAEKIVTPHWSVSASMTAPVEVKSHTRAGYRGFRVTQRKEKTK